MRERFGAQRVEVVDNGVDTAYFRPQRDVERDPARLLFLGSLDWRPNLDAVVTAARRHLPRRCGAQVPRATLDARRPPPAGLAAGPR